MTPAEAQSALETATALLTAHPDIDYVSIEETHISHRFESDDAITNSHSWRIYASRKDHACIAARNQTSLEAAYAFIMAAIAADQWDS